jgi:hypothetical protein
MTEQQDQCPVCWIVHIDRTAGLGQSYLHPVLVEHGKQLDELVAGEGTLVLTHHDRVEPAPGCCPSFGVSM